MDEKEKKEHMDYQRGALAGSFSVFILSLNLLIVTAVPPLY